MRVDGTIPAIFAARVAQGGDSRALREYDPSTGGFRHIMTWREWERASRAVAAALLLAGGGRGGALAILASNRITWPLADVGGVLAGMVTVGVYPTASAAQLRELLLDSGAVALVVDSAEQLAKAREATAAWDRPLLLVVDAPTDGATLAVQADGCGKREVWWSDLVAEGERALPRMDQALRERAALTTPDDVAMLVYTSGSTGAAKGAQLSHRCVVESARSIRDTLGLGGDDSALSFLPFSHAGERIFGLYTRIACGMEATLVHDPAHLWDAGVAAEPTLFGGMPRFFEKVYEALRAARSSCSAAEALAWDRALTLGRERSAVRQGGGVVPAGLESAWRAARAPIVPVLERHFGPRLRLATSGGAVLPVEVASYLDACGLTVLGAYGQTEHLCAAFNRPEHYRHDAAGTAMPGTTIRIAPDGEVQLRRSALTFSGYHGRPAETRAAFTEDGAWLHTGDLGTLDGDGFLRITGRTKELIALSNGKKVAPLPLEAQLCAGDFIAHALLHGEGRPYLVALLALRWPLVLRWARERELPEDREVLATHPALLEAVQGDVARANALVSRPEQVRRFAILPRDLRVEDDELTPTHKLRRTVVAARHAERLSALYGEMA
jgi:long-chain acyl-CoA synthetase